MRQALLIIDVQPGFAPPQWLVDGIRALIGTLPSVATVARHDESITPFEKQLGWHPAPDDDSLIPADRIFIKHGYAPTPQTIDYLKSLTPSPPVRSSDDPTVKSVIKVGCNPASNSANPAARQQVSVCRPHTSTRSTFRLFR